MTSKRAAKVPFMLAALMWVPLPASAGGWDSIKAFFYDTGLLTTLKRVGIMVAVLFIGWLVARALEKVVFALLKRTDLDNRIYNGLGLNTFFKKRPDDDERVERGAGRVTFYTVMLLAVAGALDVAGLGETAGPIRGFVDTIIQALPLVGKAALILGVFYVLGVVLRKLVTKALARVDSRFAQASADLTTDAETTDAKTTDAETTDAKGDDQPPKFSESAGILVFWLAMLVGLAGVFESLGIDVVATPLKGLLNQLIAIVPALAVAGLIVLGGYILGRLARAVVTNLTHSAGVDQLPERLHLSELFKTRALSDVLGLAVMMFVLLHAAIAALERLGLDALSTPLSQTIDQFWALLPSLAVAAVILIVGLVLGRVLRALVAGLLAGIGFDKILARLGVDFERLAGEGNSATRKFVDTPSEFVGVVVQVAVVLLAVVEVLHTLGLNAWAGIVATFLEYTLLKVVVAVAIVAIGLAIGNYVRRLIVGSGTDGHRRWTGAAARAAVLVFAVTMAVQQLEVASTFVLISFALVFGGLCLALALAFGLGSREVAADIVRKQYEKTKD